MAVDIHPLKISGCCDKGYKSYKLARHWKDIRTLHGRTGGRFIDVSTGDRYMQKVGSGGRPRSDHVSTCRRRIHTEAAGMSSHPNHDTCRKSGSGRAAGIGPCFDLSTTHTYGSNHSRAVVRADFAWTDGRPVYRCVDGRQIHAESRVGRPAEIGPCFDLSATHTYGSGRYE